jgi:predicted kinase|tara:strand:- start:4056 stop:4517 length:462 start_codon:yes stop_codon:yes gene_type:complete
LTNRRPILHLICGLPGSGKTTLSKQLEHACNAVRFSPDEWLHRLGIDFYDETGRAKVEGLQWELAQQLLQHGNDVVLENGFWSKEERDNYRAVASAIGATTKVHFLDVPMTELKSRIVRRNQARDAATPEVDPSSLDEWATMFEPPTDDELGR